MYRAAMFHFRLLFPSVFFPRHLSLVRASCTWSNRRFNQAPPSSFTLSANHALLSPRLSRDAHHSLASVTTTPMANSFGTSPTFLSLRL